MNICIFIQHTYFYSIFVICDCVIFNMCMWSQIANIWGTEHICNLWSHTHLFICTFAYIITYHAYIITYSCPRHICMSCICICNLWWHTLAATHCNTLKHSMYWALVWVCIHTLLQSVAVCDDILFSCCNTLQHSESDCRVCIGLLFEYLSVITYSWVCIGRVCHHRYRLKQEPNTYSAIWFRVLQCVAARVCICKLWWHTLLSMYRALVGVSRALLTVYVARLGVYIPNVGIYVCGSHICGIKFMWRATYGHKV